ncbi:Uncharacterized protein QTN25_010838 [Entamoeba marina]
MWCLLIFYFITISYAQVEHLAFDFSWFPWDSDDFYIHPFFALIVCLVVIGILILPCLLMSNYDLFLQLVARDKKQEQELEELERNREIEVQEEHED